MSLVVLRKTLEKRKYLEIISAWIRNFYSKIVYQKCYEIEPTNIIQPQDFFMSIFPFSEISKNGIFDSHKISIFIKKIDLKNLHPNAAVFLDYFAKIFSKEYYVEEFCEYDNLSIREFYETVIIPRGNIQKRTPDWISDLMHNSVLGPITFFEKIPGEPLWSVPTPYQTSLGKTPICWADVSTLFFNE